MPSPLLLALAVIAGASVGALIDRFALRWQPPIQVPAAMGAVAAVPAPAWHSLAPVAGWLAPLVTGRPSRLLVMRAATEIIGILAFAGLAMNDLNPALLLLRAALVADLLLILRLDWQYHLIQDQTIIVGLLLALAAAASQSLGALLGAVAAGLGAAIVFFLLYWLARLIYRQSALGFGDVLLAGLIGAATGPAAVFGALFLGMVLASLGGLVISLRRGRNLRTYFAYGTYLAAAAIAALAAPGLLRGFPGFF